MPKANATEQTSRWGRVVLKIMALLVFMQLIMGAFVAGLDAGYAFNTWPLMEGKWIPDGLLSIQPAWLNVFENLLTVQFTHRMMGYFIGLCGIALLVFSYKNKSTLLSGWMRLIAILIFLQVTLGIVTLILVVPVSLALGHQALAFLLLGTIVGALADTKKGRMT